MYIMDIDLMVFYIFNNGILKNIVYVLTLIHQPLSLIYTYFIVFQFLLKNYNVSMKIQINIKYLIRSITEKY